MPASPSFRRALLLPATLAFIACSERRDAGGPAAPAALISDAGHDGGTPGFFFLPPLVTLVSPSGTFDADIATLAPAIAICDVTDRPDTDCGGASVGATAAVVVFTTTSAPAITLDLSAPQYQVNWDTKATGFVTGHVYRAHVTAGARAARRELGFADVLLTDIPGQARHDETGDLIVMNDGRTIPIHLRIETAIPGGLAVSAAMATVAPASTDVITASLSDLHGLPLPGVAVGWSVITTPPDGVADPNQPLNPAVGQTDAGGITTTTFRAGTSAGVATVTATSAGLSATAGVTVRSALRPGALSAGRAHTCRLTTGGVASCWGLNSVGELGDGTAAFERLNPVAVTGGLTFAALTATSDHTCGLTTSGAAYCWGFNSAGQVGDGSTTSRVTPTAVSGGLAFVALAAGGQHSCGLASDGTAYCWGANGSGQLGDGTTTDRLTPVSVSAGPAFVALAASGDHTCALARDGAAYCWGANVLGQLGDGTTSNRPTPVAVTGGLAFVALAAGRDHTCGLAGGGAAYCWGLNGSGQLGDATATNRSSPAAVTGGVAFVALSGGGDHTCGLAGNGAAYCWGRNASGQLGDGTGVDRSTPTAVTGTVPLAALAAGGDHTCGLTSDGAAYCWGFNFYGELGDGTTIDRLSLVLVIGALGL
jgi:alpha-tubulin suppressor-like RCC1 family protein